MPKGKKSKKKNERESIPSSEMVDTLAITQVPPISTQEEYKILNSKIEELQCKLLEQTEINAELKKAREALTEEVMDLTKALFEEANGMVAAEARARATLENNRKKLEIELESTKEHLRLERQQLFELRNKFGESRIIDSLTDNFQELSSGKLRPSFNIEFDKNSLSNILDDHNYFNCLLPKRRFESRQKYESLSRDIWERISNQVDPVSFKEFSKFVDKCNKIEKNDASSILSYPYLKNILELDVFPCLQFPFKPRPFWKKICLSMLQNSCSIETFNNNSNLSSPPVLTADCDSDHSTPGFASRAGGDTAGYRLRGLMSQFTTSVSSLPDVLLSSTTSTTSTSPTNPDQIPKYCGLCGAISSTNAPSCNLKYRMRLCDTDPWIFIDEVCQERLVAVGHFFTFIRYLETGIYVNRPLIDLYYDLLHFRRNMFYTRIGWNATSFYLQSDFERYLSLIDLHLRKSLKEVEFSENAPKSIDTNQMKVDQFLNSVVGEK